LSAFFSVAAAPVAFAAPDDDRTVADCSWKLNENDGSTKLVLFVHFGDLKNMSPQDCNQVVELIGKIFEKIGYDYETRIISKKREKYVVSVAYSSTDIILSEGLIYIEESGNKISFFLGGSREVRIISQTNISKEKLLMSLTKLLRNLK
jgi:hypothetical protein